MYPLIGWLACVVCAAFTLRCAFAFARKEPDIFLALMVYACVWGVLIVFYSEAPQNRNALLPALSGYLTAITGFMVIRRHKTPAQMSRRYLRWEELTAFLLLLLAVPKVTLSPVSKAIFPGLTESDVDVFVTVILDTIGFYTMYKAVAACHPLPKPSGAWLRDLQNRKTVLALTLPIFLYWFANASYAARWAYLRITLPGPPPNMSPTFVYSFAALKIIAAGTFVPAILAPHNPFRNLSWSGRLTRFILAHPE
jgi:hypothetical protein